MAVEDICNVNEKPLFIQFAFEDQMSCLVLSCLSA